MGRTRTKGIHVDRAGHRHLDKLHKGERIFERLGAVSQDEAEARLRSAIAQLDTQRSRASGDRIVWADGAARYLSESGHKRTADRLADHVALLLPHIGALPIDRVHDGTLAAFIDQRKREAAGPTTINRSLEVARSRSHATGHATRPSASSEGKLSC